MKAKNVLQLSALTLMLIAGGCASKQCDPRDGGFVNGVLCQEKYDNRIDSLTHDLEQQSTQTHYLLAQNNRLISKLADDEKTLSDLHHNTYTLNTDIAEIELILQQIQRQSLQTHLKRLDKKLSKLSLDILFTKKLTTISPAKYKRAKRTLLQKKKKENILEKNPQLKKFDTQQFKQLKEITQAAHQKTDTLAQRVDGLKRDLRTGNINITHVKDVLLDAKYFIKSYEI